MLNFQGAVHQDSVLLTHAPPLGWVSFPRKTWVSFNYKSIKYSLGLTKFQALAKEAKATYKIDKVVLVNCEIFEKYLETFREY